MLNLQSNVIGCNSGRGKTEKDILQHQKIRGSF